MQDLIERLRKVGTGLGLIYASICLLFIAVIGGGCGGFIAGFAQGNKAQIQNQQFPQPGPMQGKNPFDDRVAKDAVGQLVKAGGPLLMVLAVVGIVMVVAMILDLIGRVLCLAVPPECQGSKYLYVSMAIVGLGLLFQFWNILSLFDMAPSVPPAIVMVMAIANIGAQILFMIFLRMLSEYIHRDDLAGRARSVLYWAIGVGVVYIGSAVVAVVGALIAPPVALLGALGLIVAAIAVLVVIVLYAKLLTNLRTALHSYAAALEQDGAAGEPTD